MPVQAKTTVSPVMVTNNDLHIVEEPFEVQNNIIETETHSTELTTQSKTTTSLMRVTNTTSPMKVTDTTSPMRVTNTTLPMRVIDTTSPMRVPLRSVRPECFGKTAHSPHMCTFDRANFNL